jgi:hypothetical protein
MSVEARIKKIERKLGCENEKEQFGRYLQWLNDDSDQAEILKHKEMGGQNESPE